MFDFLKFGTADNTQQSFPAEDDESIDRDIFSLVRLQERATEIAASHRVGSFGNPGFDLLARLEDNKNDLVKVYRFLTDPAQDEPLTPSAEWLVDNFHIVEDQLREIRQDLPRKFYRELPKLESGTFENYPRMTPKFGAGRPSPSVEIRSAK